MTHETKAGLAVSCSFVCLVGVVLSSKLWDGRAANADTLPGEPTSKELAGPTSQPLANNVAPESKFPKLQPPPGNENALQLVTGAGNTGPRGNVSDLFKNEDEDDPFQGKLPDSGDGSKNQTVIPNIPIPEFNNQPAGGVTAATQPNPPPQPKVPSFPATTPDTTKPGDKSFEDVARALQQKASAGEAIGTTTVGNIQQNAQTGAAGIATTVEQTPKPVVPSYDDMALAAQKKAQEAAATQNTVTDPLKGASSASDDLIKQQLAKQKSLEQVSNSVKDPVKDAAAGADAALAASQQQINNAADAALAASRQPINNGAGAINVPARNGFDALTSGNPAAQGSGNPATGTTQPRMPATPPDGYPGQMEPAGVGSGARATTPVSLGTPMSQGNNQFAQLGGGQAQPVYQAPPPYGSKPEVSVQPVVVTMPKDSPPAQPDNWDDKTYPSQSGDTYQSIARDYYRSDRYGQALMLYNRDYPLATDATKSNPSVIVSGQTIYLPPTRILQREYGSVILDQSAAAPATQASRPAAPVSTVPTTATPLPEKRYRVRGGGAMFLTIARGTLGDDNRWPEIYRLNPSFDPTNLVPGGTILRMPGDAKIDPADVPAGQ